MSICEVLSRSLDSDQGRHGVEGSDQWAPPRWAGVSSADGAMTRTSMTRGIPPTGGGRHRPAPASGDSHGQHRADLYDNALNAVVNIIVRVIETHTNRKRKKHPGLKRAEM